MIYTNYCSRCKATDVPLMKHYKSEKTQYHWCRDCNREKQRAYIKTRTGRLAAYNANKKHWAKAPDRLKARRLLNYALRTGFLQKPNNCEDCKEEKKLHGHHKNYKEPLTVNWVCSSCHSTYH